MKKLGYLILFIMVILLAGAGGYWFGHRFSSDNSSAESESAPATTQSATEPDQAVAQVITTPAVKERIGEHLVAYGMVVPKATNKQTVSAGIESKVRRLMVSAGQFVEARQPVAEVDPSPDTSLQLLQAQNSADAAVRDLSSVQQRFDMKLATRSELQSAQNAANEAKLRLDNLKQRGAAGLTTLLSPGAGVVEKVDVSLGEVVPAGNPLMEIDDESNMEVRLGIEPSEASMLKIGQTVNLFPIARSSGAIRGTLRLITRRVDPDTRLVNVFVSLPPRSGLLLESYLRASIEVASDEGLLVPRAAVLPNGSGYELFTVQDGHAVKHEVSIGLESDVKTEVIDSAHTLKPGDPVVIVGNYELDDGTPVTIRGGE